MHEMMARKFVSRDAKQRALVQGLAVRGVVLPPLAKFADAAKSSDLLKTWLSSLHQHASKGEDDDLARWPEIAEECCRFARALTGESVYLLHRYTEETGALIIGKGESLAVAIRSWNLHESDLVVVSEDAAHGIHIEHDFEKHDQPRWYPDGAITVVTWGPGLKR